MAKLTTTDLTSLTSESSAVSRINANFAAVEEALENTISRDGDTPNEMESDLDLNSNDLLNVGTVNTESLVLDGVSLTRDDFGDIIAVSVSEGNLKEEVATATSAPITLSGEQTIAGVLTSSSRVLVKAQADGTTNGIYVSAAGAWTRASDFDETADISSGALVYVNAEANTVGDKLYLLSNTGSIVLGTTSLVFTEINSPLRTNVFKTIPSVSYTLVANDTSKRLAYSGSLDCVVTIPPRSDVTIRRNAEVELALLGTGTLTIQGGSGVTVNSPYGLTITKQFGRIKIKQGAVDTWYVEGDCLEITDLAETILAASTQSEASTALSDYLGDIHALGAGAADSILFWDLSGTAYAHLTVGAGLSIAGTVLSASVGWDDLTGDPYDNTDFAAHNHDDRYYTDSEIDTMLDLISASGSVWGDITGTLSDQTDLQAALDAKADDLGADDNYVTDAEKVKLSNLSGTNTGDQTSIVGISGTKAEFDTACSDGNFTYVADIGVSVQAYDADLAAIAALTPSNDDIIQRKAGAWTNRTIAQLQTDLGLAAGYQPLDSDLTTIAGLTATTDNFIQSKSSAWASRTPAQVAADLSSLIKPVESFIIACSDETTALTTGTAKVTFRMPYAFTVSAVRASVTTAPTGGTLLTVDINESGTTILSTKLTFDASEKTTTTAATAAVISDTSLADDAEITIDIDAVGSTIAGAGLKVYIIGSRT